MFYNTVNIDLGIKEIRQITGFIKEKHGLDFGDFAMTALKRRVEGFMSAQKVGMETLMNNLASKDYVDLFASYIVVKDTELFRDPTFWILLKNNYIANIIKEHSRAKIWLPMCASGEEYFSLAILLKESGYFDRVEIVVTSFSNTTLDQIQRGLMESEKLEISTRNYSRFQGISQLSNYSKTQGASVVFDKSLMANTKFYKEDQNFNHDIVHMNLILFRNKMIYFNSTLQYKVCDIMYNKLAPKGLLVLGILEEIDVNSPSNKFAILNKEESIYQRKN